MTCMPQTWIEDPADHTGEHHEKHGQQFEVAAQDAAGLHMGDAASCEASLHDHLEEHAYADSEEEKKLSTSAYYY